MTDTEQTTAPTHQTHNPALAPATPATPAAPGPAGVAGPPGTPGTSGNVYRRVLATPGAHRFVPAGFVGRLPIAMTALGTVLFIQDDTGSYAVGGGVAAAGAVGEAVLAPRWGRALDRFGQARVLLVCLVGHLTGLVALIAAVWAGAPRPVWFAAAMIVGGFLPPVGACVRARWSHRLTGAPLLPTAFALESAIDELVFILGPTLVTSLVVAVAPAAGLIASGILLVVGTLALAGQRSTDPGPRPGAPPAAARMLRRPATRALIVVFVAVGIGFGGVDVAMVAFAREEGLAGAGGLLLGLFAAGSGTAGLIYGARAHHRPLRSRFLFSAGCMTAGLALPLAGVTVAAMAPLAILAGATVAPTLINGNALMERLMPAEARTEGFAWLTMAVVSGAALGSPVAGQLIDSGGARLGLTVPAGAGLLIGLAAVMSRGHLPDVDAADPAPVAGTPVVGTDGAAPTTG